MATTVARPPPCHAVAHALRYPRSRARAATSSASRVYPIPGSPVSRSVAPRDASKSVKRAVATAS